MAVRNTHQEIATTHTPPQLMATPDISKLCCQNDSPDTGTYTEGAAKDPQDSAVNYNSNNIPIPARHELCVDTGNS